MKREKKGGGGEGERERERSYKYTSLIRFDHTIDKETWKSDPICRSHGSITILHATLTLVIEPPNKNNPIPSHGGTR